MASNVDIDRYLVQIRDVAGGSYVTIARDAQKHEAKWLAFLAAFSGDCASRVYDTKRNIIIRYYNT
jgi:hypothetical protein